MILRLGPNDLSTARDRSADEALAAVQPPIQVPETPGFLDVWRARAGHTWIQGLADLVHRPAFEQDRDFNPYDFIRQNERLRDDPLVNTLIERGQFDDSTSESMFMLDLELGRRFFDDADTLQRSTTLQAATTFAGAMIGDPTNLLPAGVAFKALRGAPALARVSGSAGIVGGSSLAFEELTNELLPASETPGLANEGFALGGGALLGGLLGAGGPLLEGGISTVKSARLRDNFNQMLRNQAVRPSRLGPEEAVGAAAQRGVDVRTPDDVARVTLGREIDNGKAMLERAIDQEPVPHTVVSVLARKGDDNWNLIESLRKKYEDAGVPLRVVEHPDQRWYDLMEQTREFLGGQDLSLDATKNELGAGIVDRLVSRGSRAYANIQAQVTPGGRLATTQMSRIADAYRTLSGSSIGTVTSGAARSAVGNEPGTSMEGLLGILSGKKDSAVIGLRQLYAQARRGGEPIAYGPTSISGRFGYRQWREAVSDYIRASNPASDMQVPPNVHPSIVQGAARVRAYLDEILDDADLVGLLPGKRRLAELERELADLPEEAVARRASLESQIENARDFAANAKHYLPRVYKVPRIIANELDFKARLHRSLMKRDQTVGGARVPRDEAPIKAEIAEKFDLPDGAKVEGDLPADLRAAYRAEQDAFYRRLTNDIYDTLTNPTERHGVIDAVARQDPAKARALDIDETELADYLERDAELILERYSRVMGGRIAGRRAVQLNANLWDGARLKSGRAVEDADDIVQYLREGFADAAELGKITGNKRLESDSNRLLRRVDKSMGQPVNMLMGRTLQGGPVGDAFSYFGRHMLRLSYLNKLGSMAWAQMNDLAPVTLHMMQRPETLAFFPRAMGTLKGLGTRDLEILGLAFDQMTRARAIADTDTLTSGLGFGAGTARRISARAEEGMLALTDIHGHLSMANWITNANKRLGGMLVLDKLTINSKRLLRARELMDGGMDEAAALSKAGLKPYEAAQVNNLGLNAERARRYHELVYEHGLLRDDRPIREAMSFEEYLRSKRLVKPNFEEWPLGDRATRDMYDALLANVNATVNRHLVVTPGAFDRPLINQTVLGRIFNQFQSFQMAFVNQRLRPMSQMPLHYQTWYLMGYLALGAISDAIAQHLSGRRSLDETARLWQEEPLAMTYTAFERSGLAGWLGRPLAIADAAGLPFGPKGLLGGQGGTANRHLHPGKPLTLFGPVASDLDRAVRVGADMLGGRADEATAYNASTLVPFQNLVWLRMLQRFTGAPVTPQAIRPPRDEGDLPAP